MSHALRHGLLSPVYFEGSPGTTMTASPESLSRQNASSDRRRSIAVTRLLVDIIDVFTVAQEDVECRGEVTQNVLQPLASTPGNEKRPGVLLIVHERCGRGRVLSFMRRTLTFRG